MFISESNKLAKQAAARGNRLPDWIARLRATALTWASSAAIGTAMLATATGAWADGPRRAWTGFYAGVNAGYGWSDRSVDFTGDDPMGGGAGNLILNFLD